MNASIFFDPGVLIVFIIRLAGPLLIFKWPLLGSLLSEFVFDGSDVIIWDFFGSLNRIDYTAFDKPLDIYQLTIQAIVANRWKQKLPRQIALWLYVFRLIGFGLYEMTHLRIIFLIFANVFVNFFIVYLICEKFGKSIWFEKKGSLAIILLLLYFLKLPQEFILHYMRLAPWSIIKSLF